MSNSKESLHLQITHLNSLVTNLQQLSTLDEKLALLNQQPVVISYLHNASYAYLFTSNLSLKEEYAIKSVIVIGQAPIVFNTPSIEFNQPDLLKKLLIRLIEVEEFYQQLGGIIGYHLTVLTLIVNHEPGQTDPIQVNYHSPEGLHLGQDNAETHQCIRWGIENLHQIAEIYPIGGAGDRLNLIDSSTGKPQPAAVLPFTGRSLLEGMIRDLQALEYLYFKLYNQQLYTPIALMTSEEKDNHGQIYNIVKKHAWFGRKPESYHFFMQPLVPVITIEGNWSLVSYLTLTLKPGGHGIIWKLAQEQGVLDLFIAQDHCHALVRQINNPLASTDGALLALAGIGCQQHKSLGFLSCKRPLHCAEGTDVLIETREGDEYSYRITNIEYTDFDQKNIGEIPLCEGSEFSSFPSNTNILYVHLPTIQKALKKCSIPGKLINMKTTVPFMDETGKVSHVKGGRLESTMQNIADYLDDRFPKQLSRPEYQTKLQTFILFNERLKTISTTKKSYSPEECPLATPEQAYYDYLSNNLKLFKESCHFLVPPQLSFDEYLKEGPNCIILFHPALGPLYSIIAQKIRKGWLGKNSELQLEIAEVDICELDLEGSLIIEAASPLGTTNRENILIYGNESRCSLHKVVVRNKGINRATAQPYWKNQPADRQAMKIILHEGAEFHAENLLFLGPCVYEVPAYHRLQLIPNAKGEWAPELMKIEQPTWHWHYAFDEENRVKLTKVTNGPKNAVQMDNHHN